MLNREEKYQCKARCRLQLFTCVAVRPALTSAQLLASKAHSGELAEAAATPPSWKVRWNVPDTNCFSKVSHRLGLGLHPVYLAVSVLPGLGNPKAAGCWHLGGHIGHSVLALFLGSLSKYLLLATAGEDILD